MVTTFSAVRTAADDAAPNTHTPRTGQRPPALDVLRGLAVLGTLLTTIWICSSSSAAGAWSSPPAAGGSDR